MRKARHLAIATAALMGLLPFGGCGSGNNTPSPAHDAEAAHDHSHEHATEGPHGGHLIELGHDHKFHAELVEDDAAEMITIYILDAQLNEVVVDQPSLLISLTADGASNSFELLAAKSDGAAGSSRFESSDKDLFQALAQYGDVTGKLRVTIDGTPYVGTLDHHDHDH